MVNRYEFDIEYDFHGNPVNLNKLSEGDHTEGYYVDGSDYEQLQQAHSKAVELAAQLAKQVGELTEERDELKKQVLTLVEEQANFVDLSHMCKHGYSHKDCGNCDVQSVQQERDALAAQNLYLREQKDLLKTELHAAHTTFVSRKYADSKLHDYPFREPIPCLAEHDAMVVEYACNHGLAVAQSEGYETIDPNELKKYAQQLRDGTLD